MVTQVENKLMTGIEGDAPMGRLMREHYWIPFAISKQLVPADAPLQVRLLGQNYVAFRAEDGRVGHGSLPSRSVVETVPHEPGSCQD